MNPQDVIALTPPGLCHSSLAVAACRAGARGFVDLEDAARPDIALAAMARLNRYVDGRFGIKIGRHDGALVKHLVANPPSGLAWILLAGGGSPDLETRLGLFREGPTGAVLEVVRLPEAAGPRAHGGDGLI